MKTKSFIVLWALAFVLVSCNKVTPVDTPPNNSEEKMEQTDAKSVALAGMNAMFKDFSQEETKKYLAADYIQHNPGVPTGAEPIIGFLPGLKEAGITCESHRIFQDGDHVVFHNSYDNAQAFGAEKIVTFDVFRIADGKIAEHWDNITPLVTETVSGRTQVDGPTEITDLDKTDENKEMVKNFIDDVLFGKNPQKITDYVSTEKYHQHNTAIGDGLDGLGKALEYLASQNDMFQYEKVHKILGEGNFVLAMSEGNWHGKAQAFYDLFRIEDGKIVEHWDVIQEIPAEMAHENGKF